MKVIMGSNLQTQLQGCWSALRHKLILLQPFEQSFLECAALSCSIKQPDKSSSATKNIIAKTHMMLQRISTSAERAVDHSAIPTRVCRLILALRQSGKPLSTHISNLTRRATRKLKKFILSAQSPMADPGFKLYSKFIGRMASSMSEKSSVRCFFRILAYLVTRFLSISGKMLLFIIGQSLVDIMFAIEFPIYLLYHSFIVTQRQQSLQPS